LGRSMWWALPWIGSKHTTCCHRRRFPNILLRPEPLTSKAATSFMDRRVKERLVGASILVVLIVLIVPELLSGPATGPVAPRLPVSAPQPVRNVTVDLATSKPPEPTVESPAASSASAGHADAANPDSGGSADGAASSAGAANATMAAAATGPGNATGPANAAGSASAAGAANPSVAVGTGAAGSPSDADAGGRNPPPLETGSASPTSRAVTGKLTTSGHGWAVQLGSFASRANADKLVRQVRAQGFGVYVLPGGSGAAARYRVRVGPMADRNAATQTAAKLKSSGHIGSLVAPSP
jgi:DedD protein